jgi:hypothetical protein
MQLEKMPENSLSEEDHSSKSLWRACGQCFIRLCGKNIRSRMVILMWILNTVQNHLVDPFGEHRSDLGCSFLIVSNLSIGEFCGLTAPKTC